MLKIKDLKNGQDFYGKDLYGEPYRFRVWQDPMLIEGVWTVDCTDEGDYCFTFDEGDEEILYLTEALL